MAGNRSFAGFVLMLTGADALKYGALVGTRGDSHPGTPTIVERPEGLNFVGHHPEREEWGDRLWRAALPSEVVQKCGGFVSFGDFTWCHKAMPAETPLAKEHRLKKDITGLAYYNITELENQPPGNDFLAMSYGIRERDLWAEFLSNRYKVPAQLYDCFWKQREGPMDTDQDFSLSYVRRMDQNDTIFRHGYSNREDCPDWRDHICFTAPYEPKKICLGTADETHKSYDDRELSYQTLQTALRGRGPVSTYLKIDVEGSEWPALWELLQHPEEVRKIRALDMEVHPNMYRNGTNGVNYGAEEMERKVQTMEGLAKVFAVTGSTVGTLARKELAYMEVLRKDNPRAAIDEPRAAYTTNGMGLDQYCISYVNREMF